MAYDLTSNPQGRHTVTAFFDDPADAEKARADLLAAGFAADDIVRKAGAENAAANAEEHRQGILRSLLDIFVFMPPHDQLSYAEGLRRGGVALAVHTMPDAYEQAIDILDRDGAVDLDEREVAWKQEGWNAEPSPARPGGPGSPEQAGFEADNTHDKLVNPAANNDVRERIGTGTSDMTVGTDLAPGSAVSDTPAASMRDDAHGRRRVRSYLGPDAARPATDLDTVPAGVDPQI